jgi:hypothetical protein
MLPAMLSETNTLHNWAQRNEATGSSSQQLTTASSEVNNERALKRRITDAENIPIQPLKVAKLETSLRWIERELMNDQVEFSDDDLFLIDLEVYQHTLWTLAYN